MNATARYPVFLLLAAAIPVLWIGLILLSAAMDHAHPIAMGGAPPDLQKGISEMVITIGGGSLLGLIFTTVSLCRNECLRSLAWAGFCFYFIPSLLGLFAVFDEAVHGFPKF